MGSATVSSARRRRSGSGAPWGWLLLAAGVLAAGYGLWSEFTAPVLWRGVLDPGSVTGGRAVYTSPPLELPPGPVEVRVSLRPRRTGVSVVVGGLRLRVTAPELPGWEAAGRLKVLRRSGSTVRRRIRLSGSAVATVPERVRTAVRLEIEGAGKASAHVRVVRPPRGGRALTFLGLALLAAGVAVEPRLRRRLFGGG